MTVAAPLNPNYVYIVALNPSNDANPTAQGPIPVIAPPWGNGFVAGGCTYFVQWNPNFTPAYGIYQFTDPTQNNFIETGVPLNPITVPNGGSTLQFTIDLSQIAPSVNAANLYNSLQINFLSMDRTPHGAAPSPKGWDALGDSSNPATINDWITVPLRVGGTYNNTYYQNIEPAGDVIGSSDPSLDIINFSVQVSSP
jgi:hypothetical protein